MLKDFIRLLLLPFGMICGHRFYIRAKKFEADKKYKDACYAYATALLNGAVINEKQVQRKIKDMWNKYGPFNYEEFIKKEIAEHGDTPEHCAEAGHAAVMSIINEIVSPNPK